MTEPSDISADAPRGLHHIQVVQALLSDHDHPARPGGLVTFDGTTAAIGLLGGGTVRVEVIESHRLSTLLAGDDICRIQGYPLVLVNAHHRVLAVATGRATPPPRLALAPITRLEDGRVVEVVSHESRQPSWQIFEVVAVVATGDGTPASEADSAEGSEP